MTPVALVQRLLDGVGEIGADAPGITRDAYGRGENTLVDVVDWYHQIRRETPDIYADHDWTGCVQS